MELFTAVRMKGIRALSVNLELNIKGSWNWQWVQFNVTNGRESESDGGKEMVSEIYVVGSYWIIFVII